MARINRVALGTALAIVAAVVVVSGAAVSLFQRIDTGTTQARVLAENVAASLMFRDASTAATLLQTLRHSPDVRGAAIYDTAQHPFAGYTVGGMVLPAAPASEQARVGHGLRYIALTQPIAHDGQPLGTLHLIVALDSLYQQLAIQLLALLAASLLALLTGRHLSRRLSATALQPLVELTALMERVSDQARFDLRAPASDIAELDTLAKGFNDMLEQIQERDQHLTAYRNRLEAEVVSRTADLRHNMSMLRQTQEIAKVGGWEFESTTGRMHWTDEVYRILDLPADHAPLDLEAFLEFFAPEGRSWARNAFRNAFGTGDPFEFELPLVATHGARKWVHATGRAELADGKVLRVYGNIRDTTERRQAQEALEQINVTLAQRVKEETAKSLQKERLLIEQARHAAMGEMIGNIAHQWRQPLSALGLVVQNLRLDFKEGCLTATQLDDYVDKARRAIAQMSQTIDDFRDFFKPDRRPERFSPVKAIRDCADLVGASLGANDIGLRIAGPADCSVYGYPGEFSQVILNLIANAKDAIAERKVAHGTIDINVLPHEGGVTITVDDNAGGIAEEYVEKVFDPYFTTKEHGTGVGLYMTRTIVEQHMHGSIRAGNTFYGAHFTLDLPHNLSA
jgi:signal transduction histidine kinase